MKIIGFPVDVSRSQDGRIVRGLRTRQSLIQATLDLIQAGDVEPTSAAIATIAGVSSRALFQHFTNLADLYAARKRLYTSASFAARVKAFYRIASTSGYRPRRSWGLGRKALVRDLCLGLPAGHLL